MEEDPGLATLPGYHALFTLEPTWRVDHAFESRLHLSPKDLAKVLQLLGELERELKERAPGFRCMATTLFTQIVCYLSRCYGQSSSWNSQSLLRIGEAISHLETHYSQSISLEDLAQIARMPTRSFQRVFTKIRLLAKMC